MDPALNTPANDAVREGKLTIPVGNSGDRSNEHVAALRAVHQQFGDTVNVVVPMGYPANNDAYINDVRQQGLRCLARKICTFSTISWNLMTISRSCENAIWAISSLPVSRDWYAVSADSGGRTVRAQPRKPVLAGHGRTAYSGAVYL